jgi:hypothetical protein
MSNELFNLKNLFDSKRFIFCYSGPISQDMVEGIGEAMKDRVERATTSATVPQRVFGVFVEQVQNVMYYSAETGGNAKSADDGRSGIVVIGQDRDAFYVESGNLIDNEHVDEVRTRLSELEGKDKGELKALYKARIKQPAPPESRGAGVGFIDIARKASEPVEFSIHPVDEHFSFFSMKARIVS